jgi:NTP pyrophosphatase (non-canonical NTP hydrolase)
MTMKNRSDRDSLKKLTRDVLKFRDARDWKQFHNFKDLAITLCLESAELLEHTQWKSERELEKYLKSHKEHVSDELCDVLHMVLLLAEHAQIDLPSAFARKMKKNEAKYPVHKARGSAKKYKDL